MNEIVGKFTGMDLLKVAFPEPGSRVPRIPEGSNGVRPFDDEYWCIPVSDEEVEPSEWIDEKVSEEGIDLLAWYNPHRYYGDTNWGIYFDERKMNAYASGIYRQVKKIRPSAKYSEVRRIVWKAVERHEYEHCVQEIVLAKSIAQFGSLMQPNLDFAPFANDLEAIATHQMILDPRVKGVSDKRILNLTMFILGQTPMPRGYSDWNRVDIEALERNFTDYVDRYLPKNLLNNLRGKLLSNRGPIWLDVPKRLV
jgi:hypothetical protein